MVMANAQPDLARGTDAQLSFPQDTEDGVRCPMIYEKPLALISFWSSRKLVDQALTQLVMLEHSQASNINL